MYLHFNVGACTYYNFVVRPRTDRIKYGNNIKVNNVISLEDLYNILR